MGRASSTFRRATTEIEVATQNDANLDRFVLKEEMNDPNLDELDTWTIETATTLYEFGNPT